MRRLICVTYNIFNRLGMVWARHVCLQMMGIMIMMMAVKEKVTDF